MIRCGLYLSLVLALGATSASASTGSPAGQLAASLAVSGLLPGSSTALALDLHTGKVLYALNPVRPLEPASNEKLAITYAAFVELGANYRFPTEVLGAGRLVDGTWHGTLVLKGFGDPTLTTAGLTRLATLIRHRGIRRITGGVVGDASWFDRKRTAVGWLPSFEGVDSPPLSALVVDRAVWQGHLASDPALAAVESFDAILRSQGVAVPTGRLGSTPPGAVSLATVRSEPLSTIVAFMDEQSDNFTAEMITKAIGATIIGVGSTAAGTAVTRQVLERAGIPLTGVRIVDGSGLSRSDRITGRELAALLLAMWKDPTVRPLITSSLAVAGESGTLSGRLREYPARGLVRAKTGTTDIASALSGYVGSRFAFVTVENGHPVDVIAAHAAQDAFAEALARLTR